MDRYNEQSIRIFVSDLCDVSHYDTRLRGARSNSIQGHDKVVLSTKAFVHRRMVPQGLDDNV